MRTASAALLRERDLALRNDATSQAHLPHLSKAKLGHALCGRDHNKPLVLSVAAKGHVLHDGYADIVGRVWARQSSLRKGLWPLLKCLSPFLLRTSAVVVRCQ